MGPERAMTTAADIRQVLLKLADPKRASHSSRYFKTGPGEYAEGDRFHGIRVPVLRQLVKRFRALNLDQLVKLLRSPVHEERLLALFILVDQYRRGPERAQEDIYRLYLANTTSINNWDLVDSSAHKIVGPWLESRNKQVLFELAVSTSLWERRIAVISTFHFINLYKFDESFRIAGSETT